MSGFESGSLESRVDKIEQVLQQLLSSMGGSQQQSGGEVSEAQLTEEEFDGISEALKQMEGRLSDRQKMYLLGIFGVAAEHFSRNRGQEGRDDPRKVSVRNFSAFQNVKLADGFSSLVRMPRGELGGLGGGLGGDVADSVGGGVSVVCVGVDWSKDLDKGLGTWRTNPAFGDVGGPRGPGGGFGQPGGFGGGRPGGFGGGGPGGLPGSFGR